MSEEATDFGPGFPTVRGGSEAKRSGGNIKQYGRGAGWQSGREGARSTRPLQRRKSGWPAVG